MDPFQPCSDVIRDRANPHDAAEQELHGDLSPTAVEARDDRRFRALTQNSADIVVILDTQGVVQSVSSSAEKVLGYAPVEVVGKPVFELVHPEDSSLITQTLERAIQSPGLSLSRVEWRIKHRNGCWKVLEVILTNLLAEPVVRGMVINARDVTEQKLTEAALHLRIEREQLLMSIVQRIRQSLHLKEILNTTVAEVRQLLQTDRVIIFCFAPDWSGDVVTESVAPDWSPILGSHVVDPCFQQSYVEPYRQGRVTTIDDLDGAQIAPCHRALLANFQVRANLIVPILQGAHLWGLLIAHHCSAPRHWQAWEIEVLKQLATSLEVAIHQSQLYQQIQQFNIALEQQVQQRTQELRQALHFEALLKRITDKVRDSLDENQILQTAVDELGAGLQVLCCDVGLYNAALTTSTIRHEYNAALLPQKGQEFLLSESTDPAIYQHLFRGQYSHFCPLKADCARLNVHKYTILASPLFDDQGSLGDMWLFRYQQDWFNDQEIRLVQQVANQCAIALRQSRLYQAAQAQVRELERLHRLKDDFLSTISHELRTPMSSIKMAAQMLRVILQKTGLLESSEQAAEYFQILHSECQREISLIDDLLDLSRLEAQVEPIMLMEVDLRVWIPAIAEPFEERTGSQRQHLQIQIPPDLPLLTTDLKYLERILTELLNNACKYTPAGEQITVAVRVLDEMGLGSREREPSGMSEPESTETGQCPLATLPCSSRAMSLSSVWLQISVCNSGIELPTSELAHIFDKFYRIPSSDPWRHGGTGLGLALVKKMAAQLGGSIEVESANQQTCFILQLPFKPLE